jgi:hypothetical protein
MHFQLQLHSHFAEYDLQTNQSILIHPFDLFVLLYRLLQHCCFPDRIAQQHYRLPQMHLTAHRYRNLDLLLQMNYLDCLFLHDYQWQRMKMIVWNILLGYRLRLLNRLAKYTLQNTQLQQYSFVVKYFLHYFLSQLRLLFGIYDLSHNQAIQIHTIDLIVLICYQLQYYYFLERFDLQNYQYLLQFVIVRRNLHLYQLQ